MIQGINKEYIFKEVKYKNFYLKLLRKNIKEANIKIIAFCIMDNHAHLLIYSENVKKLSVFMQKVNSVYAQFYNYMENGRVGYVFRDRYKTEPILDRKQLIRCIKYIHNNPVKAGMVKNQKNYKYSSYNYFYRNRCKNAIFSEEEMKYICNENDSNEDVFIDVETNIIDGISDFLKKENIKIFEIFEKRDILKKLIKYLKNDKKIKYIEIRKMFGITRGTMDRLK